MNPTFTIAEAASYNTGLKLALETDFDLIVLDMSMPTFDRTESTHGGRFRSIAGKEIAMKLAKAGKLVPFVVLTGYKDFSVNSENLSIDQIDDLLKALGSAYKGCINFDVSGSEWKERLKSVVKENNA
jgi:CheY-like chemotaxis protein